MSEPLIKREWPEAAIIDRARNEELLIALAISLGAKSIVIEWDELFARRMKYDLSPKSRRSHRRAMQLAIARLEKKA